MTAVKDGQIRPVDDIVITRPGPRLVEGLQLLAVAIHPDADIPGAPIVGCIAVPGGVGRAVAAGGP